MGDYEDGGVRTAIERACGGCTHDPAAVHPMRTFESREGIGMVMILRCPFDRVPLRLERI